MKRKLTDIFCISLLISFSLIIAFYNLMSERFDRGNLAATFLFVVIFILFAILSYILSRRAVTIFIGCYFSLLTLCSIVSLVLGFTDLNPNVFTVWCSIFFSPLYGFGYITDGGEYAAYASALIIAVILVILAYKTKGEAKQK